MRPRTLTVHRRRILILVANGHTNAQIGRQLGIHRTTVDRHLAEIFRILGARDRANAVAIALLRGEIRTDAIHDPLQGRIRTTTGSPGDGSPVDLTVRHETRSVRMRAEQPTVLAVPPLSVSWHTGEHQAAT